MEVPPPGDSKGSGEIHALASRAKPAKKYPRHHRGCARPSKKLFRTFRDLARLAKNFFRTFRDHARLQKKIPGRFATTREPQKIFLSHFAHRFRKGKAFPRHTSGLQTVYDGVHVAAYRSGHRLCEVWPSG